MKFSYFIHQLKYNRIFNAFSFEACIDSANGLTDTAGDDCSWYTNEQSQCGDYDGNGFFANQMCCACGGGNNPNILYHISLDS